MNTTSLEISKKLYEISGWGDTYLEWFIDKHQDEHTRKPEVGRRQGSKQSEIFDFVNAYDLGYLLRKLPENTRVHKQQENVYRAYTAGVAYADADADTPEDAAALLAIKLLEEGVLK